MSPDRVACTRQRTVLPLPRQGGEDRQLGQVLVHRGLLSPEQLDWALQVQRRTRSRIGEVLVSSGLVSRMDLHRGLARAWDLPFVDVPGTVLDPDLVVGLDHAALSEQGWLPLHRGRDGRVLVAVTERPGPALRALVETHLGEEVDFAVTSSWDIAKGLTVLYRDAIADEAALGLWRRSPARSALSVPSRSLRVGLGVATVLLLLAAVLAPTATLTTAVLVLALGHLVAVGSSAVVSFAGRRPAPVEPLADDALPVHTVLVPVPSGTGSTPAGAAALAATIAGLGALNYPADKLEILLLVQEGDTATRASVSDVGVPETVTFVGVPRSGPTTRALACNVGLFFARGDLLAVLDVGDVMEPDQLRRAAAALRPGAADPVIDAGPLVCVQAAVSHRGRSSSPFAALVALERAHHCGAALPGHAALGLPLGVGGPSSHVRTEVLRRLGGWDPWNDAAEADLGLRAYRAGLRVGLLASTTSRPVTHGLCGWLDDTAHAVTGRAQATLVHLRRRERDEHVGASRLLRPVVAALGGTSLLGPSPSAVLLGPLLAIGLAGGLLPAWLGGPAVAALLGGALVTVLIAALGAARAGRGRLVPLAPLVLLLGPLQTVAVGSALVRLLLGARRANADGALPFRSCSPLGRPRSVVRAQ